MKKNVLLLAFAMLLISVVYAQDNTSNEKIYKQVAGSNSFELAFDPASIFNSSSPGSMFDLQDGFGIRYRRFMTELSAFRIGVDISVSNSTFITQQANEEFDALELKTKFSSFGFLLRPGYEKHFKGTKRLSPYIGGELNIGYSNSTVKEEVQEGNEVKESKRKDGTFRIGAAALAGLDFFVAKNLYLGLEFTYGIYYKKNLDRKITDIDGEETIEKRGSAFSFTPGAYANFRIGYLF
jgi:opacity protein-like surface antigen